MAVQFPLPLFRSRIHPFVVIILWVKSSYVYGLLGLQTKYIQHRWVLMTLRIHSRLSCLKTKEVI